MPPESVGGKFRIITCKGCNNKAGEYEAELIKILDFASVPDKKTGSLLPKMIVRNKQTGEQFHGIMQVANNRADICFHEKAKQHNKKLKVFVDALNQGKIQALELMVPQPDWDGVNIIIRYTLRLFSAQQFERATKLILACEFIRQHQKDLGNEIISIGLWIGNATIPNSIERAKDKYKFLLKNLNDTNFDSKKAINPFQLTNCQWCNSKIISRINNKDTTYSVGHRITNHLQSHCLNPKCNFNEMKGSLPILLVDDDIYPIIM